MPAGSAAFACRSSSPHNCARRAAPTLALGKERYQGGQHQLSRLTFRDRGASVGIDDLRIEVVLEDVHAALVLPAFHGHTRSDDLG